MTSAEEKEKLQQQCARMFFKNRLSFNVAEDVEFQKFVDMLRPGMGTKLITRWDLSGKALDKEHDRIDGAMRKSLQV